MIFTVFEEDYSSSDLIAVIEGPDEPDPQLLWKVWYTENVLDVIGRNPNLNYRHKMSKEEKEQLSQEAQAWFNTLTKKHDEIAKELACESDWRHIAVQVLCCFYGFRRVENHQILDLDIDKEW